MKKKYLYGILGAALINTCALNHLQADPKAPCTTTALNFGPNGPTLSVQWIYCEGAGSTLCKGSVGGANTWGLGCTVGHQPFTQDAVPATCTPVSALNLPNCP